MSHQGTGASSTASIQQPPQPTGLSDDLSAFEQVHAKRHNRLLSDRLRDLVFVKVNSRMMDQKQNKKRDPIEKIIDDILEDDNEFITGIVPEDNWQVQQEPENVNEQPEASSQAQGKRHAHVRKKWKKSIHLLLNCVQEEAIFSDCSSSSASEIEGNHQCDDLSDVSADSD